MLEFREVEAAVCQDLQAVYGELVLKERSVDVFAKLVPFEADNVMLQLLCHASRRIYILNTRSRLSYLMI